MLNGMLLRVQTAGKTMSKQIWSMWLRLKFHLWQKRRFNRLVLEYVSGKPFLILPQVFNPTLFYSSELLVDSLNEKLVPAGSLVLDMGTGSGIGAIFAARWADRVVAVDINPDAVRCARINALLNDVQDTVAVVQGDLFAPLAGESFDVILFNPPYYRGEPNSTLDHAFHATDVVERFADDLAAHLKPGGHALVLLSSTGDEASFLSVFRQHRLQTTPVARREMLLETLTLYQLFATVEKVLGYA